MLFFFFFLNGKVVLSPRCTICVPGCIEQHKLHYSGCFVLWVDESLPQYVTGFESNRDVAFIV